MARVKKCVICGKAFETAQPNKKYCCYECKEIGRILRRLEWEDRNPNYNKTYMKAYRAKND